MPLIFVTKDGKSSRYNLRKFGELPYHLIRCQHFDDLFENVLFNYQWLYAKLSACPVQAVLSDFEDATSHMKGVDNESEIKREIMLVADSIRLGGAILGILIIVKLPLETFFLSITKHSYLTSSKSSIKF